MDLLDELNIQPARARTFTKHVDIQEAEFHFESDDDGSSKDSDGEHEGEVFAQQPDALAEALAKVKRRLNGEAASEDYHEEEHEHSDDSEKDIGDSEVATQSEQYDQIEDTQRIDAASVATQKIFDERVSTAGEEDDVEDGTFPLHPHRHFKKPPLFTQEDDDDDDDEDGNLPLNASLMPTIRSTESKEPIGSKLANMTVPSSPPTQLLKTHKLFVEESEDEDEEEDNTGDIGTTQQIAPTQALVSGETQVIKLTQKEQREQKIKALAEKKKALRLMKEQNDKSKNDKTLSNKKGDEKIKDSKKGKKDDLQKELEDDHDYESGEEDRRVDEPLNIGSTVVKNFVKTDLLAAFGLPTSGKIDTKDLLSSEKNNETPSTTPLNSPGAKKSLVAEKEIALANDSDNNSDSDDEFDVLNILKHKSDETTNQTNSKPLFRLKSPEQKPKMIELDDSDDSDDDDIPVRVSKSEMLELKARFSKKTLESKKKMMKSNVITRNQMLEKLRNASHKQIKESRSLFPDGQEKFDMLQPEDLDVEDLLRKYIEHANTVKDHESSTAHKHRSDNHDDDEEEDSDYEGNEVVESDVPESADDDDDNSDVEEGDENVLSKQDNYGSHFAEQDEGEDIPQPKVKSRKRNIVEDDEDIDEIASKELTNALQKHEPGAFINLGSFGGNFSQSDNQTQRLKDLLGVSMTQAFEKGSGSIANEEVSSTQIFQEARKNGEHVLGDESVVDSRLDESLYIDFNSPKPTCALIDEPDTQLVDIEPPTAEKSFNAPSLDTQKITQTNADSVQIYQDTLPDTLPSSPIIQRTRRLVKKSTESDLLSHSEEDNEEEEDIETEEERLKRAEFYKQQRRKALNEEKRRKRNLKSKGLDQIMENEAEESEDEWQGVGGAEGERSDEEDSEDEKMFDDVTKIKQDRMELAKEIAAEDAQMDQKMLMKILKDLETGNWKRRGGDSADGFDFYDEEDEVMRRYKMYQQSKLREKFEEDEKLRKLARDKKSKAFFESITETQESKADIFGRVDCEETSEDESDSNPFINKENKDKLKSPEEVGGKKKIRITQAFVQKSLSFLGDYDDTPPQPMNYMDDDDSFDDLHTLKQKSTIYMPSKTPQKKKVINVDLSSSPSDAFRVPSLKRSFVQSDSSAKCNEVTISTSYKAASSARASVMSFGKGKSAASTNIEAHSRVLKARKIEKTMKGSSSGVLNKLGKSAFE